MAKVNNDLVKVFAKYNSSSEHLVLWGFNFTLEGDNYVAELDKLNADILIDAGKVKKA